MTSTTPGTAPLASGITLAYESFGEPSGVPILLVMGLGTQMIFWPDELCQRLTKAAGGAFVVRYDNRDVGLSTHLHDAPAPDVLAALGGDTSSASYRLADMAADAVGLLDHLSLESAHVVGVSMGGMIVQMMAIEHPDRVRSMTSIMSTTGEAAVSQPKPEAMQALLQPPTTDRDAYADSVVATYQVIGGPGYPADEGLLRRLGRTAYDRGYDPLGVGRQLLAIYASGDRTEALRGVRVPTLVIHGEDDPLVPVEGGRATAAAVPGSELVTVPGMGHDLPPALWDQVADLVVTHVEHVEARRP